MDRQTFEKVSSVWTSSSVKEIAGQSPNYLEAQRVFYADLGNHIVQNTPDGPYSAVAEAVGRRAQVIEQLFDEASTGQSSAARDLPALGPSASSSQWEKLFPADSSAASRVVPMAISYLAETSVVGDKAHRTSYTPTLFVTSEIASYCAWKALSVAEAELREEAEVIIKQARVIIDQLLIKAKDVEISFEGNRLRAEKMMLDLKSDIEKKVDSIEQRHIEVGTTILEQEQKLSNNEAFAQAVDNNFVAFANSVREELKIGSAKQLWDARSRSNQFAFIGSSIVAAALIVLPIIGAFFYRDVIISYLHVIETPLAQVDTVTPASNGGAASGMGLSPAPLTVLMIGRLLTVTIPIALWFWLIKLVVRYNYRSMVLADDAKQRSTMMTTYFHLIEEKAAMVEDRALILAALFRPAPGHGPDNIEPPDFTDFINKMKS